jgi:YHS domain-containing protein
MFRVIFYLLIAIVLISVLRGIIGIVLKGFGELLNPGSTHTAQKPVNQVPLTGELKKDPACGTYIAAATSIQQTVGGEMFYFCSKECRDKYVASAAR